MSQPQSCKFANLLTDADCLTDNFCILCKDLSGKKVCVDKSESQNKAKYINCISVANMVNRQHGNIYNPMYDNFYNKPISLSLYDQATKNKNTIDYITDFDNMS